MRAGAHVSTLRVNNIFASKGAVSITALEYHHTIPKHRGHIIPRADTSAFWLKKSAAEEDAAAVAWRGDTSGAAPPLASPPRPFPAERPPAEPPLLLARDVRALSLINSPCLSSWGPPPTLRRWCEEELRSRPLCPAW
jgi:hypothetical protein